MKVSGFTFVRNAIKNDFPVTESIRSILPIVDEFIVNFEKSEDDTLRIIQSIGSSNIPIMETIWDETKQKDGEIYRGQTDLAINACSGGWAFYIQAGEVVHEQEIPRIQKLMKEDLAEAEVLGFLFRCPHFYGNTQLHTMCGDIGTQEKPLYLAKDVWAIKKESRGGIIWS